MGVEEQDVSLRGLRWPVFPTTWSIYGARSFVIARPSKRTRNELHAVPKVTCLNYSPSVILVFFVLSGSAVCEVAVSTKLGDGAIEESLLWLTGGTEASDSAHNFERNHDLHPMNEGKA